MKRLLAIILLLPSLALALGPVTVIVSQPQTSVTINDGVAPAVTVQIPDSGVLSIVTAGPQGPKGDKGDSGSGGVFGNMSSYVTKARFGNLSGKITQPLGTTDTPQFSTILISANGLQYRLTVDNNGNIGTELAGASAVSGSIYTDNLGQVYTDASGNWWGNQ